MSRLLLLECGEAADVLVRQLSDILTTAVNRLELRTEILSSFDPGGLRAETARILGAFAPAAVVVVQRIVRHSAALLRVLRSQPPALPIIVVGEARGPDEVTELLQLGASDFLTPPLSSIDVLPRILRSLPGDAAERLTPALLDTLRAARLVGQSAAFLSEVARIPVVARSGASVFISGETGTGKELFARAIHGLSPRSRSSFIPVNCGAIPVELVENELFGHDKGAFTSADTAAPGLIEEADGGTLFLDEIDSLPLLAQVKLLRFLQDGEYRPLGARRTRTADIRVVAATNVNFERAVEKGLVRRDLYYRLNIIPFNLPPLRERSGDVACLARHFVQRYAERFGKAVVGLSPEATQRLLLHGWPGNVRELEHVIERAVAIAAGPVIQGHEIVLQSSEAPADDSFRQAKAKAVERFERTYLQGLLLAHQGNITRAAMAARKNRRSFFELLRKYGIEAGLFREPSAPPGSGGP